MTEALYLIWGISTKIAAYSLCHTVFAIGATETGLVKLVNDVTWVKKNPTPRQFRRRLVSSTEPFFISSRLRITFIIPMRSWQTRTLPKNCERKGGGVGQKYFKLINQSDLSESEKRNARIAFGRRNPRSSSW